MAFDQIVHNEDGSVTCSAVTAVLANGEPVTATFAAGASQAAQVQAFFVNDAAVMFNNVSGYPIALGAAILTGALAAGDY